MLGPPNARLLPFSPAVRWLVDIVVGLCWLNRRLTVGRLLSFLPCSAVRISVHPRRYVCERQFRQNGLVCSHTYPRLNTVTVEGVCCAVLSSAAIADAKPLPSAEQAELPWLCLLVLARLSSSCTRPESRGIFAFLPPPSSVPLCYLCCALCDSLRSPCSSVPSLSSTRSTAGTNLSALGSHCRFLLVISHASPSQSSCCFFWFVHRLLTPTR